MDIFLQFTFGRANLPFSGNICKSGSPARIGLICFSSPDNQNSDSLAESGLHAQKCKPKRPNYLKKMLKTCKKNLLRVFFLSMNLIFLVSKHFWHCKTSRRQHLPICFFLYSFKGSSHIGSVVECKTVFRCLSPFEMETHLPLEKSV